MRRVVRWFTLESVDIIIYCISPLQPGSRYRVARKELLANGIKDMERAQLTASMLALINFSDSETLYFARSSSMTSSGKQDRVGRAIADLVLDVAPPELQVKSLEHRLFGARTQYVLLLGLPLAMQRLLPAFKREAGLVQGPMTRAQRRLKQEPHW